MTWNEIQGHWWELRDKLRGNWRELTDEDLDVVGGRREELALLLQELYGITREEADRELEEFVRSCCC